MPLKWLVPPQYPLYTLGVMNKQNNIVPVAWLISSSAKTESVEYFLKAVKTAALSLRQDFWPGSIHIDDDGAERAAAK